MDAPVALRDQNPLLRGFYLPTPRLGGDEGTTLSATLAWSNTTNLPATATERLYVDEETAEVGLRASRRAGDWLFSGTVPLSWRGGGVLDGIIDDWHALLGVNRGDRPRVQSNSYRVSYAAAGSSSIVVEKGPAIGDASLEAGRLLWTGDAGELAAWAGAKLPTGSRAHGMSDGALDGAAWLAGALRPLPRWELYAQAGVMRPGGTGGFASVSREVAFGTLGSAWRLAPSVVLLAQLDSHGAFPSSELNFLKVPLTGTFAGRFRLSGGLQLDVGLQEDLATNHSPDFSIYVALVHGPRAPR